jgi:Tol biopolymer transport system component
MTLAAGTKLGPYELQANIGAGGMGEVYRARDTRLDRTVAIKILLSQFSADAELKQRFDREAKSISSLNHAHVCQLYDVGSQDGIDFLVMEFLEGETLAARLQRGPIPIAEVVKIASQIAEALEKAHRCGLVHRDLKPGNVMLTQSGAKLMDFGLAKALVRMASASGTHTSAPLLSAAMTMSSPSPQLSPLTSAGAIVGTIQYMAPEQIEGREADARSDIFALGAVLYEMATAKRPFQGKSQITVASAILEKDPEPVSSVQSGVPLAFDRIVQTCLAKDPEERFQTAQDVKLQLRWVLEPEPVSVAAVTPPARRGPWVLIGGLLLVAALAAAIGFFGARSGVDTRPVRATIDGPEKAVLDSLGDFGGAPVLSPDGSKLAFVAHLPNTPRALWVRSLDSFSAQRLDGTDGASHPFWSPDGQSIGFFASSKLNRIAATGGPVAAIAAAPNARGGAWMANGVILYAPDFQSPIFRINVSGGPSEPVTKIDSSRHSTHRWPFALPDGKHFLYLATSHTGGHPEQNGLYFGSLDGTPGNLVVATDSGGEFASGLLLFHAGTALMAQPMDPSSGKLSGAPHMVVEKVRNDSGIWRSMFTASQQGRMVYQIGADEARGSQLVWFDRAGKQIGHVGGRSSYMDPQLSPDGKRVAVSYGDPNREIWVFDIERGTETRLTFAQSGGAKVQPSWSPDGKFIAFTSALASGGGTNATFVKAANGSGSEKPLITVANGSSVYPSWSPDGKYIVYIWRVGPSGHSVYAKPVDGGDAFLALPSASPQSNIIYYRISPNGRWIAYVSDESGTAEVYVAPFPHADGKWQISTSGAGTPVWRRDSKELFYSTNTGDYMAVSVIEGDHELKVSTPTRMFSANVSAVGLDYDASADGKRFLMNLANDELTPTSLHLVTNWTTELKNK